MITTSNIQHALKNFLDDYNNSGSKSISLLYEYYSKNTNITINIVVGDNHHSQSFIKFMDFLQQMITFGVNTMKLIKCKVNIQYIDNESFLMDMFGKCIINNIKKNRYKNDNGC